MAVWNSSLSLSALHQKVSVISSEFCTLHVLFLLKSFIHKIVHFHYIFSLCPTIRNSCKNNICKTIYDIFFFYVPVLTQLYKNYIPYPSSSYIPFCLNISDRYILSYNDMSSQGSCYKWGNTGERLLCETKRDLFKGQKLE